MSVTTRARAASSCLDTEDVVQDSADEVMVEERAARMAHHKREDGQPLDVLRRAAEQNQFRNGAHVGQDLPEEKATSISLALSHRVVLREVGGRGAARSPDYTCGAITRAVPRTRLRSHPQESHDPREREHRTALRRFLRVVNRKAFAAGNHAKRSRLFPGR